MKKCVYMSVLFMAASAMANAANVVPYEETFESYAAGFEMPGTNGWSAAASSNAVVSASFSSVSALQAYSEPCGYPGGTTNHTKVLEMPGTVTNSFSADANQTVWVDMMLQAGVLPSIDEGLLGTAHAAIYFNTEGHPMVYHRDVAAGTNRWTEISETIGIGDWVRATLGMDYQTDYFQIKLNGNLLTNDLAWTSNDGSGSPGGSWFKMPNAADRMNDLVFDGHGADVDDLVVTTVDPFAAMIKSIEHFSGDVYRLVVDWQTGNQMVPPASHPIKTSDLALGSWDAIPHSIDGSAPWYTTNLNYTATEGSDKVIYVKATEATAFFAFGK